MRRASWSIIAVGWAIVSCSLIVTDDVPEYHCSGNEASVCPSGLICNTAKSICVQPGIVNGTPGTNPGDINGEFEGGPVDNGSGQGQECIVEGDCQAGLICGAANVLTLAIVPRGEKPVCTKPCCTSADCAPGFICYSAGTGGNYCVSAQRAQRTVPAGNKPPGQPCGADAECRSGLCGGGFCTDSCCSQNDCASGTVCRVDSDQDHLGWTCTPPERPDASELGSVCSLPQDCKNESCVYGVYPQKKCIPSCCNANDCTVQGFPNNTCAYGSNGTGGEQLKWCFAPGPFIGATDAGASCNADSDCHTRLCDPELKVCATICCTDKDCAQDEACRPAVVGTPLLRCVAILH